ncbi:MAG: SUMF1/EgtB/PvdO family nonheme iron enzyme [Planctomycetales bacterium]|nr:SUMF1/EgtB/PvdO family nonheme iron enzyme [Planctomycetales bacterium]
MSNHTTTFRSCLLLWVLTYCGLAIGVEIQTVPIGLTDNLDDVNRVANDGTCCYGAVPYKYRIGQYEVTNEQYTEYLNAIAASDPYDVYNPEMGTHIRGGISRSGESGSYTYSVRPNMANKPVNFILVWDAMRFVNWLHNGQPTGAQDASTTEDGVYTLNGVNSFSWTEPFDAPKNNTVGRNEGARWFLPSEDEWYKSAYYDPRTEAQGGPPGDTHYWYYGTQSNQAPQLARTDAEGNVINPGPNVANYRHSALWNSAVGNVANVGGANSATYFGAFDQAGNVWEWTDTIIEKSFSDGLRPYRGVRGGCWDDWFWMFNAFRRPYGGDNSGDCHGLRVARAFSADDLNGDGTLDVEDIDLLSAQVRQRTLNTAYDLDDDQIVDRDDRRFWVEHVAKTYFGDANLDGQFNSSDIVHVSTINEYEDGIEANSTWATGDWDGDGEFSSGDFVYAFMHDGYELGPRQSRIAAVPEPSCGIIVLLIFAVALRSSFVRK